MPTTDSNPEIEVGLVLAGSLDAVDREAVDLARRHAGRELQNRFPEFTWRLHLVQREEMTTGRREEPVAFFQQGQTERDLHKWDFVLVMTSADLIGHDKPFALAAVSRTLDLAVISTARVDPRAVDASVARESRIRMLAHRIAVIVLRCLGHLNGLDHHPHRDNLMWDADDVEELDPTGTLTAAQIERMRKNLLAIADARLEEVAAPRSLVLFLMRAAWCQRREILAGVVQAAPWEFPIRLSRLTTAAVSASLILLMTAEVWDMSMNQSLTSAAGLMLTVITVMTAYVVIRQQLLVRRQDRLMTEQIAVSNITATVTVLCGMVTTMLALFAASLIVSRLLFPQQLVRNWAATLDGPAGFTHYLLLCGVVTALSVSIGAFGAVFENQSYFRHVIFVDEEL